MKWAIREAVDVYFKAKSAFKLGARTMRAGEPVLIFDTVKTSTLETSAEMSYVTGGRGNARLLSFEGDKVLTFSFEEALLSAEGMAILSGADLIPSRNKYLPGAATVARSVISHYTEKYSVITNNRIDTYEGTGTTNARNIYPDDTSLGPVGTANLKPRGGEDNVWLTRKPYVGQNGSIYVMLLDDAGEISGAPVEVNLYTDDTIDAAATAAEKARHESTIYLRKFHAGDYFIAFDKEGNPIPRDAAAAGTNVDPVGEEAAIFDDGVGYYVDADSAIKFWISGWDPTTPTKDAANRWVRQIPTAATFEDDWFQNREATAPAHAAYAYLLQPSGGVAQPKCFKEGVQFVYKVNLPSVLYQDIVLLDYYVEYRHNATQVSILPDKFAPFMYVEGSSLVRRASDGIDLPVEFVIPKLKITTALTFTLQSTGDASTFNFQGDAYPDFSKFDLTRKVLADIQILDADDNYDDTNKGPAPDPTSYRRYQYNDDTEGDYLWKDPAIEPHANIDYSDAGYNAVNGGPATVNADADKNGQIYHA